jgi:hypothetical protein
MKIKAETIKELVEIIAGLVKEGLTFIASKQGSCWEIELTGGF